MSAGTLQRLSAFTEDPQGGNPAGVWIGDALPDAPVMQRIARDVGYSETAFLAPREGKVREIRYYSPLAEVPFCGHATIASGVALGMAEGVGTYELRSSVGPIDVRVSEREGHFEATLQSVAPSAMAVPPPLLEQALAALGWHRQELDPAVPPAIAYAGAHHLVLAAKTRERLARLDYDFEVLKGLMLSHEVTTAQLVWRETDGLWHARNPFPVGGVVEDPATGAAAAALGGYLREAGLLTPPFEFTVRQGEAMGRPSRLYVQVPALGGVLVSGAAVRLD